MKPGWSRPQKVLLDHARWLRGPAHPARRGEAEVAARADRPDRTLAPDPPPRELTVVSAVPRPVRELQNHPVLRDQYSARDPRFTARAANREAHYGYDRFYRELDREIAQWLRDHRSASQSEFAAYLRWRYSQPDLLDRFPNGFDRFGE